MSIINRICEKHQIDYNLIFDYRMHPIRLMFGQSFPQDLKNSVQAGLDKVGAYTDPAGIDLSLDVESDGIFTLSRSGKLLYKFANRAAQFFFPNYDPTEAIVWTIYAIATGNDKTWLKNEEGKFISCRCFSARQQAVASRIMKSVNAQYTPSVSAHFIQNTITQMKRHALSFTQAVPVYSYRPISEEAYTKYRAKTIEMELGDIAEALFGTASFEEVIASYQNKIKQDSNFTKQLKKAQEELTQMVYQLPIMAVGYFFTELNACIDRMETYIHPTLDDILKKTVRFTLNSEKLKSCFAEIDDAYIQYAENAIYQDFLRQVCESTQKHINSEFIPAQRTVVELYRNLSRFCFVDENSFCQEEDDYHLTWKQLSNLQDSYLSTLDVSWDDKSFIELQSTIHSKYSAHQWMCSDKLNNLATMALTTDQYNNVSVPLMDERYVIALWTDDVLI